MARRDGIGGCTEDLQDAHIPHQLLPNFRIVMAVTGPNPQLWLSTSLNGVVDVRISLGAIPSPSRVRLRSRFLSIASRWSYMELSASDSPSAEDTHSKDLIVVNRIGPISVWYSMVEIFENERERRRGGLFEVLGKREYDQFKVSEITDLSAHCSPSKRLRLLLKEEEENI